MTIKFSADDIRDLHARYEAGESTVEIARSIGCHSATLRNRFHRMGLHVRDMSTNTRNRMAEMSAAERHAIVRNAHDAKRGRKVARELQERTAQGRQRLASPDKMSKAERAMAEELKARGIPFVFQQADGIYNIDFAVAGSVAVECFGGHWHATGRHLARHHPRTKYLLDRGWHVMIFWIDSGDERPWVTAIEDIVALTELTRRDPSARRQYRVIWRNGDLVVCLDSEADDFPLKPAFEIGRDSSGRYYRIS